MAMSLDTIMEIARASTDNDERKRAASQLRQVQEKNPEVFLAYTFERIASPAVDPGLRFFLAAAVVEFVEQSWYNTLPKKLQLDMIDRYLHLLLPQNQKETLPSLTLAWKVARVLALMVRRSGLRTTEPGQLLPPPLERAAKTLVDAAVQSAASMSSLSLDFLTQCFLTLHVLLKEMERVKIGQVFRKLCTFLVPAMSSIFAASALWDPTACHLPMLYLMKCALRVFGLGVFEPSFYPYLLNIMWRLAEAVAAMAHEEKDNARLQRFQRLMEYSIKVQLTMVRTFLSRLHELPPDFLLCKEEGGTNRDASLFGLLVAVIESPIGVVATEKMVYRSMLLFSALLEQENCDGCSINSVLVSLVNSPLLQRLMQRVIMLLADDTSEKTFREWAVDPELCASEFEIEADDGHLRWCASELLLALTASTCCASKSLQVAWNVVNALLDTGDVSQITAALHAIGSCCYTMSADQDPACYMIFLKEKLLPLITASVGSAASAAASPHTSPFVLRRVVWIIGMWCGSVHHPELRREVHMALASLLTPSTPIVVQLTTLQSIYHFISDPMFNPADISADCVGAVLLTAQRLLPLMHTPFSVRLFAHLVQSMIVADILRSGSGELLLDLLLPSLYHSIEKAQSNFSRVSVDVNRGNKAGNDDVDHDDMCSVGDTNVEFNGGSVGELLRCFSRCLQIIAPELEERVWSTFSAVVIPCTVPGGKLTSWVDEDAWDALLTMSRAAHAWLPATRSALVWCLDNMTRDVLPLHLVVRCAYTLMLLSPEPEEHFSVALTDHAMVVLTQTSKRELAVAYFALLAVMVRRGDAVLRSYVLSGVVRQLLSADSVQAEMYSVYLALLATWSLLPRPNDGTSTASFIAPAEPVVVGTLRQILSQHPNGNSFAERVVLLVDVLPSQLVAQQIALLLQLLLGEELSSLLLPSAEDKRMVHHALEGLVQEQQVVDGSGDASGEVRDPREMLLELFGDEEIWGNAPHLFRLTSLFGACGGV